MSTDIPAGWYPDHTGEPQDRWWDGGAWTDRTRPTATAGDWPADAPTADAVPAPSGTGPTPATLPSFTATTSSSTGGGAGRWIAAAVAALVLASATGIAGFVVGRTTATVEQVFQQGEVEMAEEGGEFGLFDEVGDGEVLQGDGLVRGASVTDRVPLGGEIRFALVLDEGGPTTIVARQTGGGSVDPVMTLLDADGVTLEENDDGFDGCCDSRIRRDLEPGDYTVVVRDFAGGDDGEVQVTVD